MTEKETLFHKGLAAIDQFSEKNKQLTKPEIYRWPLREGCGMAYQNIIVVDTVKCSNLGRGGRAWSWPGNKTDRTPFGVLIHELGHVVDIQMRASRHLKKKHLSERVSGYEPNNAEVFAETFRVWWSNPDLLRRACPERYKFIESLKLEQRTDQNFLEVLAEMNAPSRIVSAASKFAKYSTESKKEASTNSEEDKNLLPLFTQ